MIGDYSPEVSKDDQLWILGREKEIDRPIRKKRQTSVTITSINQILSSRQEVRHNFQK